MKKIAELFRQHKGFAGYYLSAFASIAAVLILMALYAPWALGAIFLAFLVIFIAGKLPKNGGGMAMLLFVGPPLNQISAQMQFLFLAIMLLILVNWLIVSLAIAGWKKIARFLAKHKTS